MNEKIDELQRCGHAYENMINNRVAYKINFFTGIPLNIIQENNKNTKDTIYIDGNTISEINIIFTPKEFKHLSGIHKFNDENVQDSSEKIYKKVIGQTQPVLKMQTLLQNKPLIDDTVNPPEIIANNGNQNKPILKSDLLKFIDRLSALENLYHTIAQSKLDKKDIERPLMLKMYAWNRKASHSERPHNSDIKADFLIEIYNENNTEKPYTDFFMVREKDGTYRGMLVFHSEVSYAKDDKGRKVPEMTVLSFEKSEIGKEKTVISASAEVINECRKRTERHKEAIAKELSQGPHKKERTAFFSKLGNQRSRLIKKENKLNKENHSRIVPYLISNFSGHLLKNHN